MAFDRTIFGAPGTHSDLMLVEVEVDDETPVVLGVPVEPTRLCCGQCGSAYYLGEEVADERLLHACARCISRLN
jgi:hypothetical protein